MRWTGHVACVCVGVGVGGGRRGAFSVLVGKSRHRLEQNVKMITKEMG